MKNKDAGFRIVQARTQLLIHQPFFGQIALRMKVNETDILPSGQPNKTFATDGNFLHYNKDFINTLTDDELKGVIAHEVMHVAMRHHLRLGNRNPEKFNDAGDYAINSVLLNAGFTLPEGAYVNSAFDGMNAEKIYTLLPDKPPGNKNGNGDGDGDGSPGMGAFFEPDSKENPGNRPSQRELNEMESNLQNDVNQAAVAAKAIGKLPGNMEDIIEGLKEAKIHYTELLRDFVSEIAKNDYSWMKPNPRYACTNVIMPGLHSEEVGNIAFIIDSSGSVSKKEKEQHAAEISSILEEFPGLDIEVIYVDTKVQGEPQKITSDDLPVKLIFKGGGGTSFAPGFDWLRENEKDPQAILYFTDGYSYDYPDIYPECETIWLCTSGEDGMEPPFGRVIGLDVN